MVKILRKEFIKMEGEFSRCRFKLACDDFSDLPDPNSFDIWLIDMGSTAHVVNTGETYMLNSSGKWKLQKKTDEEGVTVTEEELRDNLDMAVKMICPTNAVIFDDAGNPSTMVYIPSFKLSEVLSDVPEELDGLHPAFIVNGMEIPGFWYSKYQNCVKNERGCSLPAEDPQTNISFEKASAQCEAKGKGWHLSTAAEWAAIALWCKKNGFQPKGNNNYGKDVSENNYKAIPTAKDESGKTLRVATGTGHLSWSHNNTLAGIWDLNGNVAEWQGGFRVVWGEVQIFVSNNSADSNNSQSATSSHWRAINANTGELVEPECKTTDSSVGESGNTIRLDYDNNVWVFTTFVAHPQSEYKKCKFSQVRCDDMICEKAKILLRSLILLPEEEAEASEYGNDEVHFYNNISERCYVRGGEHTRGENVGLFFTIGGYRTNSQATIGFRSAYIPELAVSSKKKAPSKNGTGTPLKHSFQPAIIDEEEEK